MVQAIPPTTWQPNSGVLAVLYDASGNPVSSSNPIPVTVESASTDGATYGATAALASGLVLKNSPGTLFDFVGSADATLGAAAWWLMIFDATAVPADGAVTPVKVYAVPTGVAQVGGTFGSDGVLFLNGICMCVSTTGPFTKTASAHAFLGGSFK